MAYKKVSGSRTAEIRLDGSVYTVDFGCCYNYYAVRNDSDSVIYVSTTDKSCTPNNDSVVSIPSGGGYVHYSGFGGSSEIYISGTGGALVVAQDDGMCPFKPSAKGGDSGFSGDYNDLTSKPDIPVPSNVIDSNSTNETVSTSKAVFDYVISTLASAGFKPVKVTELPEVGSDRVLYLLPKDDLLSGNLYNEYLWIDGTYELVGSTAVDLSDYATIEQLNGKQDILAKSTLRDDSVDWDTLSETSIHSIEAFNKLSDSYTHGLEGVYGYGILIIAAAKINVCYQIYFNARCEIYIRSKHNLWDNWKRVDVDAGVTLTKPAISDPTTDWDTITETGFYTIGYDGLIKADSHGPLGVTGWGLLSVINTGLGSTSPACIRQIYEAGSAGLYTRNKWRINGEWSPWYVYRCENYTPS